MTTWKKEIEAALKDTGDNFESLIITLTKEELNDTFYSGLGCEEGTPFTAWSEEYVYFPVCYDGAEWVGYVKRNPCDDKTHHWGGGGNV